MKTKMLEINENNMKIHVIPGHFVTSHSHTNYYIDLTEIKAHHKMAKQVAAELASKCGSMFVDTIICMERMETVGAFMADFLSQPSLVELNNDVDICVLTPEQSHGNQMIFRENTQNLVRGKSVLLLMCLASTGKTISQTLECLTYYGGHLAGVCALFSIVDEVNGYKVNAVFTKNVLEGYRSYSPNECPMCASGQKIDAIVNNFGYSQV